MFNKNSKDQFKNSSIIGESVIIDGNFECEEDVVVYGKINGSIKTSGDVYIKSNSIIEASIKANNIFIEGSVDGNIDSNGSVEIFSTAKVSGDVATKIINIEKGALFNGKCSIKEGKEHKTEEVVKDDISEDVVVVEEVKQEKRKKKI